MKDKMNEIKSRMEARVKAEPGNPDAWRELAQENRNSRKIAGKALSMPTVLFNFRKDLNLFSRLHGRVVY